MHKGRLRGLSDYVVSMMIDSMVVLDIFILAAKAAANHHKEYRNEEDCQYRCGHHPAHYTVPTAFCAPEPAPVLITSGITPRINANEVIRIGRKRIRTASSVASIRPLPSLSIKSLANSTISIAFFADKPMVVSRPTRSKRHWSGHGRWQPATHR